MKDDQRPAAATLPAELPAPSASPALEVSISADHDARAHGNGCKQPETARLVIGFHSESLTFAMMLTRPMDYFSRSCKRFS